MRVSPDTLDQTPILLESIFFPSPEHSKALIDLANSKSDTEAGIIVMNYITTMGQKYLSGEIAIKRKLEFL